MNLISQVFGYVFIFISLYFEVFLILSFFEKGTKKNTKSIENFEVPVTILVPVFNEETTIAKTLDSLLALEYPKDKIQVIIINDGSTDNTQAVLEQYQHHPNFRIVTKPNGGKYTALNLGLSLSTTKIVGCLDADSFVSPDALRHIVYQFQDPTVMAVSPSMIVGKATRLIQKMQKVEYYYGNFLRNALSRLGALYVTAGPFSFFRKEVFETIGEYRHAHSTEDLEIALRMQKHHMKIVHAGKATVYTTSPDTLKKLYKQRVRWVSGFLGNLVDYRAMMFNRHYGNLGMLVLPFSLLGILCAIPILLFSVVQIFQKLFNSILIFNVGGLSGLFPASRFDPFFVDTSASTTLSLLLIGLLIVFIGWGKHIAHAQWRWNLDFIFMFPYVYIAPLWVLKSLYNTALNKKVAWR